MTDRMRVAIRAFGPFERAIEKQWASFAAATGCRLSLEAEQLDLHPLYDTLFVQEGLKRGEWDIAFVVTDWLAEAIGDGALLDLAPLMRERRVPGYSDVWAPSLRRAQEVGNAIYGLPYHDGPECLIYRTDLLGDPAEQTAFFERYGRPLRVPETWDEFIDVARHFTRPMEGRYGTIVAAYPDGHNAVYDFCLQLWSRGGELTDAEGRPALDSDAAVAGLDFYRALVRDRTLTPAGQEAIDSVKSGERFADGSIAMMANWFGFAAVCEQPGSRVKGKVDVAPLPAGPGGTPVSLLVYWLLCVGAGSRHARVAYDFLRHCASAEMDRLVTLEGGIGCRRSTWDDPEVAAAIPFAHRMEELHESARELPRSRALPRLAEVIDRAVQASITTDMPTAEILRRAQREAAGIRL